MKRLKLFICLCTIFMTGILSAAVCHAGAVDDICNEYGYQYRWTFEVELDDTYKGTGLYEISDNGRVQISFIVPEGKSTINGNENYYKWFVFSGKSELITYARDGGENIGYLNCNRTVIKDESGYHLIGIEDEAHPLHYMYQEGEEPPFTEEFTVKFLRQNPLSGQYQYITRECVIISGDGGSTPIYIGDKLLREAEDTDMLYFYRRIAYHNNWQTRDLPVVSNSLPVKAVVRENRKTPPIPDDINIKETEANLNGKDATLDFEYDIDEIKNGEINKTYADWDYYTHNIGGSRSVFILRGGSKNYYVISHYEGSAIFELDLPINDFDKKMQEIAPDGKIRVSIMQYKEATFERDDPSKNYTHYKYLVKFEGSGGVGYGGTDAGPGHVYPINNFDGNAGTYEHKDGYKKKQIEGGTIIDRIYPQIYVSYDEKTGAISEMGLAYISKIIPGVKDCYETFTVPIEDIQIDEGIEHEYTKENAMMMDSDYLTTPVVEKARAERGVTNVKVPQPSLSFESTYPSKPTASPEPTTSPEPTVAPEKDEIGIIVNGEQLALDVKPQVSGDRVLVPLRAIFEKLGAEVDWNEETGVVTISKDGTKIEFQIDNTSVKVNDGEKHMDVPAQIIGERTLVPTRFLAEELGYVVNWDEENQDVLINESEG